MVPGGSGYIPNEEPTMTDRELTETLRLLLDLWAKAEAMVEADLFEQTTEAMDALTENLNPVPPRNR